MITCYGKIIKAEKLAWNHGISFGIPWRRRLIVSWISTFAGCGGKWKHLLKTHSINLIRTQKHTILVRNKSYLSPVNNLGIFFVLARKGQVDHGAKKDLFENRFNFWFQGHFVAIIRYNTGIHTCLGWQMACAKTSAIFTKNFLEASYR